MGLSGIIGMNAMSGREQRGSASARGCMFCSAGNYVYSRLDRLSGGPNSEVFVGRSIVTNTRVAIKRISLSTNPIRRLLLDNEVEALQSLDHPNILRCHQVIRSQDHCLIVTELCSDTLKSAMSKRLTATQISQYWVQMVSGCMHMVQRGFIHRDIKPANIFLTDGHIRIGDFGYSRQLPRGQSVTEPFNVGTPSYMAPESLQSNCYSEKSDVWSLGVILFQMIADCLPFQADDESHLLTLLLQPSPTPLPANCPAEMRAILQGCLQKDPAKRINLARLFAMTEQSMKRSLAPTATILSECPSAEQVVRDIINNELAFIRLLERTKCLCQTALTQLKPQILFLLEWTIRHRIKLMDPHRRPLLKYVQKCEPIATVLPESLLQLQSAHSSVLTMVVSDPQDRLQVLLRDTNLAREDEYLQMQAKLRETIVGVQREVCGLWQEEQVSVQEHDILLLDFLMTVFQLNAVAIECYHDLAEFGKQCQFAIIEQSPTLVDLRVYAKIMAKFKFLHF